MIFKKKKGKNLFYEAELVILDNILKCLNPSISHILEAQIDHVQYIQRPVYNSEINLYYDRRSKPQLARCVQRLIHPESEYKIAAVSFTSSRRNGEFSGSCYIWIVNGLLFMIEFSEPFKINKNTKIIVGKVEIYSNVL